MLRERSHTHRAEPWMIPCTSNSGNLKILREKIRSSFPGARVMERLLIAEGLREMLGAAKGP